MPFKSDRQRRLVYARAEAGEAWARKFIRDSGGTPPPVKLSKSIDHRRKKR